ncbi:hypothetical protein EJB05_24660, partial [Eragrostis curvula]
ASASAPANAACLSGPSPLPEVLLQRRSNADRVKRTKPVTAQQQAAEVCREATEFGDRIAAGAALPITLPRSVHWSGESPGRGLFPSLVGDARRPRSLSGRSIWGLAGDGFGAGGSLISQRQPNKRKAPCPGLSPSEVAAEYRAAPLLPPPDLRSSSSIPCFARLLRVCTYELLVVFLHPRRLPASRPASRSAIGEAVDDQFQLRQIARMRYIYVEEEFESEQEDFEEDQDALPGRVQHPRGMDDYTPKAHTKKVVYRPLPTGQLKGEPELLRKEPHSSGKMEKPPKRSSKSEHRLPTPQSDRGTPDSLPDSGPTDEYRALRRQYLMLEEENFALDSELSMEDEEIKALEAEKSALLDQLVVLEGLVDPSEMQPQ